MARLERPLGLTRQHGRSGQSDFLPRQFLSGTFHFLSRPESLGIQWRYLSWALKNATISSWASVASLGEYLMVTIPPVCAFAWGL